jgi:hypothetical protein
MFLHPSFGGLVRVTADLPTAFVTFRSHICYIFQVVCRYIVADIEFKGFSILKRLICNHLQNFGVNALSRQS